jgi:sec-independent protein translocase protein TatA
MWANGLTGWHLLILVSVVVLLFGAKRLPDAARSLGKSMRIFKSEIREMQHGDERSREEQMPRGKPEELPKANPVQSERVEAPPTEQNHSRPA